MMGKAPAKKGSSNLDCFIWIGVFAVLAAYVLLGFVETRHHTEVQVYLLVKREAEGNWPASPLEEYKRYRAEMLKGRKGGLASVERFDL